MERYFLLINYTNFDTLIFLIMKHKLFQMAAGGQPQGAQPGQPDQNFDYMFKVSKELLERWLLWNFYEKNTSSFEIGWPETLQLRELFLRKTDVYGVWIKMCQIGQIYGEKRFS